MLKTVFLMCLCLSSCLDPSAAVRHGGAVLVRETSDMLARVEYGSALLHSSVWFS
jgi:hypothetical protein